MNDAVAVSARRRSGLPGGLLVAALIGLLAALWMLSREQPNGLSCPDRGPVLDTGGPPGPCETINGRSDSFAQDIRPALGARLAALWITNDTIYNVGIVNPTYSDAGLVAERAHAYGATGLVVPMKYPPGYLGRLFDSVGNVDDPHNAMCLADVDESTNKLNVVLRKPDPQVMAEIKTIVPADILVLRVDSGCGFLPL